LKSCGGYQQGPRKSSTFCRNGSQFEPDRM
jgi:hypothetical protein